jgi:hypothetical protein
LGRYKKRRERQRATRENREMKLLTRCALTSNEIIISSFHSEFSIELNYLVDSRVILKVEKKRLGIIDW